jgi:4-hydroxy-tetrahydrodipicolinate reductase
MQCLRSTDYLEFLDKVLFLRCSVLSTARRPGNLATMITPVQILIHGASGRMGQTLLRLAAGHDDLQVAAAVAPPNATPGLLGVPFHAPVELASVAGFDVAIDFSSPQAFDAILGLCVSRGAAFVSGTTGLTSAQQTALIAAAERIPVLWAANFSIGVAVMEDLVERAVKTLHGWDCDIVEAHHTRKLDAPSGTALALGAAAERGGAQPRYASLRAGDIVGEHLVQFTGPGERIELVHRATNRDIFASGALHAARRLAGCAPGAYRLRDLF